MCSKTPRIFPNVYSNIANRHCFLGGGGGGGGGGASDGIFPPFLKNFVETLATIVHVE